MSRRDDVVAAAEALRIQLPLRRPLWPEERWVRLQAELLEWLDRFVRCHTEEDWQEAWSELTAIASRHGLLKLVTSARMLAAVIPEVADPATSPERSDFREEALGLPRSLNELAERLYHLLGSSPRSIQAYPEARVAGEVFARRSFQLQVLVRAEPTAGAGHKVTFPHSRGGLLALDIVLRLPLDGAITGPALLEHPLLVSRGCDSAQVSFELFAVRPGCHRVEVRFLQSGITRAELTVPVLVQAAPGQRPSGAASTTVSASLHMGGGRLPPGLVLGIERSPLSERALEVTFMDVEAKSFLKQSVVVDESCQHDLVSLCQRLKVELALDQAEARETRLSNIGMELAAHLLPPEIHKALASSRYRDGTPLHIENRATWFPWELFFVTGEEEGRFLGDWFAVTRWHGRAQLWSQLDGTDAVLVAPRDSALNVEAERRALERLTHAPVKELRKLPEFQGCLRAGTPMGFLHFACHGASTPASHSAGAAAMREALLPSSGSGGTPPRLPTGVLLLEDGVLLQTSDIPRLPHGTSSCLEGTFVFLNACESGLPGRRAWGHESWVNTFFEAGAAALVAPSWTISDACAGRFAEALYGRLADGDTLARAAWWARKQVLKRGSADRLGYAVYAFPEARRPLTPTASRKEHS